MYSARLTQQERNKKTLKDMPSLFCRAGWIAELCKKSITIMSSYFQSFSQHFSIKFGEGIIARFAPIP
jgi:hypothetical protein